MKNEGNDKARRNILKIQKTLKGFSPQMRQALLSNNVVDVHSSMDSFFQYLEKNNILIPQEKQQSFKNLIKEIQRETKHDILEIAKEVVEEHKELCKELYSEFDNIKSYTYDAQQEAEVKKFQKDWEEALSIASANKKQHEKFQRLYKENMEKNIGVLDSIRNAVHEITGIDLKNLKSIGGALMKKMKSVTGGGYIKKYESEQLSAVYSPKSVVSHVTQLAALAIVGNVIPLISITGVVSSTIFLFPMIGVGMIIYRVFPLQIPIVGSASYIDPQKAQSTSFNFIQKDGTLIRGTRESIGLSSDVLNDRKNVASNYSEASKKKDYFMVKDDILNADKKHQLQKGPFSSR